MTKARDIASAAPAPSTVSATELGYLDGVTSAIQTQVDAKIPKTLTTTTGDIIYASSANTPARLGIGSSNQVLTVSGGVPTWAAAAAGGKVLQVVSATYDVETTSSSATFATTGLTATITPTSASSKILCLVSQNGCIKFTNNTYMFLRLVRGSTVISNMERGGGNTGSTSFIGYGSCSTSYLDSPATTSATTYKTEFASQTGTGFVAVQVENASVKTVSTMTLLEIGA